ncbi:phage tail sheath protein FI [Caulobacter ginsengisoli]|uniref:Phage tail sheath protein FI n=1 Tax=Caulobacter ginsengisoli TaxID=400775 RepID=A0ABU0IQW7_9CAUL|nr:phage tail sheath subtilisin-like domain-containing protein [Caulobacter ginsengisoli]MDQ0464412.1 phage tail sheath protein FI [Caulobacter ginsengisoli]
MPVSVSYPGLYIEELPFSAHSIAAAPTSVGAFIGYSHPYRTKAPPGKAIRLFSFSDYETWFGGLFTSGLAEPALARSVYEFFLNGGSDTWVVGLTPKLFNAGAFVANVGDPQYAQVKLPAAGLTGITFTALEPTDIVPMQISITNVRGANDVFDLVIAYGSRVETYRGVSLTGAAADSPGSRINDISNLVTVAPAGGGYGVTVPGPEAGTIKVLASAFPAHDSNFSGADFIGVFQADTSLDKVEQFNILVTPGVSANAVQSAAMAFAERKRAFYIADPPPNAEADASGGGWTIEAAWANIPRSQNAALYFPYLQSTDQITGKPIDVPPSGFVAGIYARTDSRRGVWKAPAGLETTVLDTTGPVPTGRMNDPRHGVLNKSSINVLRQFTTGTVVFGARTTVADNDAFAQSKYVPVRRMTLFIEQTLLANLRWVIFEPNDEPLWLSIRSSIENFMLSLFNQGALQGSKPSLAFQVKCDASTTTADDQQNGIVNIVVAFAPLKPAEFVVIKIAHLAGQAAS